MEIETIKKAIQVKVREELEPGVFQTFGAVQLGNILIAMDNGDIIDANAPHIEIVEYFPWISLSDELLGD